MELIALHDAATGEPVLVNADQIRFVRPEDFGSRKATLISFDARSSIYVRESLNEIDELIRG